MNNLRKKNIENFVNSDANSAQESDFLKIDLKQYFEEKQRRTLAEKLAEDYSITKSTQPIGNQAPNKRNGKKLIILAITLALLTSLFIAAISMFNKKDIKVQYQRASVESIYIEMPGTTRGEVDASNLTKSEIATLYEKRNFEEITKTFEQATGQNIDDVETMIRVGVSYASTGNLEKGSRIINAQLTIVDNLQAQELRWALVNMYILNDQAAEAQKILDDMNVTDYKYQEAKNLLK